MKNNLRTILADKKIRGTKVFDDTGISRTTISRMVNESADPHLSTLIKLADYLDVSLDALVGRERYITEMERDESFRRIQSAIEDSVRRNQTNKK